MANMVGADLAQMQQLEARFRAAAQGVVDLRSQVDRVVTGTAWTGPASERFREAWNGRFRAALDQLRDALDENAQVVASRRQAIESATH